MPYTALYRKLRPTTFGGIVGQEHIVRTLVNQIELSRVSHAYLFCGTRGTGKTSTAKVFATAINCENVRNGSPCGECRPCLEIAAGRSMNVIEIDAASNNGVDNIRDIREEVKYPPAEGRFKVYIIDEVHMLSSGAFNALLKTLEEPPPHIVFILATTDPQKIPATVLSRCQRFDFKRIKGDEMVKTLQGYIAEENLSADEQAVRYISRVSDGSLRDALSIIDQCVSFYFNEELTLGKVLELLGSVDSSVLFKLTDALAAKNTGVCLALIDDIVTNGRDIIQFTTDLVSHFRDLLITSTTQDSKTALHISLENRQALAVQSKNIGSERVFEFINTFSELLARLKYASDERILLEVTCIRLCNTEVIRATQASEQTSAEPAKKSRPKELEKPDSKKAVPSDIQKVGSRWLEFVSSFPEPEASFLKNTKVGYLNDNRLSIVCDNMGYISILKRKEDSIKQRLSNTFSVDFDLNIIHKDLYNQSHKSLYGGEDDFQYSEIEDLKSKIAFEIDIT